MKQNKLIVQDIDVSFKTINNREFISLTDIARSKNPDEPKDVVKNWLRSKSTIEFLGLWETINNENFKGVEFDSFKKEFQRLIRLNQVAIQQLNLLIKQQNKLESK